MAESQCVCARMLAAAVRVVAAPKLVREHAREGGVRIVKRMCSDSTRSVLEAGTA